MNHVPVAAAKSSRIVAEKSHSGLVTRKNNTTGYAFPAGQYMVGRRNIVQHFFGTLKLAFGFTQFLCKGIDMINTEMNLAVIAYNLR